MSSNDRINREYEDFLQLVPPNQLHTTGLALFYLSRSGIDNPEKCIPATSALQTAFMRLGTKAMVVPATITLTWLQKYYGNKNPAKVDAAHFDTHFDGHLVIITENGDLIDPTVSQFKEISKERGVLSILPLSLTADSVAKTFDELSRNTGEPQSVGISLPTNRDLKYDLYPPEIGQEWVDCYREMNREKGLINWEEKLADDFILYVAESLRSRNETEAVTQIINENIRKAVSEALIK